MITTEYINNLSYTDFIAFIKETNRCPGGKDSIRKIVQNSFLNSDSKILDVGSNTGFNSLEFAHITQSEVYGIDVSEACVAESKSRLSQDNLEVQGRVNFSIGSAYDIPFKDNFFDLVMCGGATSFMDDKKQAVNEYFRVIKPWGFLAVTQLFYSEKPPQKVLNDVSQIINSEIKYMNKEDWIKVFEQNNTHELYLFEEAGFKEHTEQELREYVSSFLEKPHIKDLAPEVKKAIFDKWFNYMNVFNENSKYLSYFIALFRKNVLEEEKEYFIKK